MVDPYASPPSDPPEAAPSDAADPARSPTTASPAKTSPAAPPAPAAAGPVDAPAGSGAGSGQARPPTHVSLVRAARTCAITMAAVILCMVPDTNARFPLFVISSVLAIVLLILGISAGIAKLVFRKNGGQSTDWAGVWGLVWVLAAPFLWVLSVLALFQGVSAGAFGGGAWGRPLRIRGRQLHPNLRHGSDWTEGERPDPTGLDEHTRAALEALWLHDAQKEHASVPAFTRVSWLLAAVGAPADLLLWCHRAAMEEIDHTQRCFALAAGYAGRSFTVEAMPDLLLGGLDSKADPLVTLAVESLSDGCQLEDFNADVAARCAAVCTEPATRSVLDRIAREERTHAEFSWAVLAWTLKRDRERVLPHLHRALAALDRYPRPTAVSPDKAALMAKADVAALRRHGRLADAEWAEAWTERLAATRARAAMLFGEAGIAEQTLLAA